MGGEHETEYRTCADRCGAHCACDLAHESHRVELLGALVTPGKRSMVAGVWFCFTPQQVDVVNRMWAGGFSRKRG